MGNRQDNGITFEQFIMTAMADNSFRTKLRNNPRQALQTIGIDDDDLVEALENFDWESVEHIAGFFDPVRPMVT